MSSYVPSDMTGTTHTHTHTHTHIYIYIVLIYKINMNRRNDQSPQYEHKEPETLHYLLR